MSDKLTIQESVTIKASINDVWAATAEDFGGVETWAASVSGVTLTPAPDGEVLGTLRQCVTPFGDTRESMLVFDEASRTFAYDVVGLPAPMTRTVNTWTLREEAPGTTTVTLNLVAELEADADPQIVAGLRGQLAGLLAQIGEELAHWVEKGEPHPRKVSALQS